MMDLRHQKVLADGFTRMLCGAFVTMFVVFILASTVKCCVTTVETVQQNFCYIDHEQQACVCPEGAYEKTQNEE